MSKKIENQSTEIETLPTAELETASGGWGAGWAYHHPYMADAYFSHHPYREERFAANHPWAAARMGLCC